MFLELLVEQAPKIKILRIILENKMSIKDIAHLNLQCVPLGFDIKSRPGLTRCFDKSTKATDAQWLPE